MKYFDNFLTEKEIALRNEVIELVKAVPRDLLRRMDADDIEYPYEFIQLCAERNLLGLRFPEEYGGRGNTWLGEVAAIEEMGVLGNSLGCLFSLPSIVGEGIVTWGTPEQKEKYLRPTLQGKLICAEALTEPRGGSDFFGATTSAVREGDHYVLNGEKRFIVGARGADYFFVYARTNPDVDPQLGLSVFLVERDMGVEIQNLYELMGSRGSGTGRIVFKDVRVPAANLLWKENGGGEIFNRMMIPERLTSAAGAIGGARAALEVAARYSTRRKTFGKPIRKYQAVSFKIADSVARLDAARSLVYMAAKAVDLGQDARRIVSEAKKTATERAWEVVNDAMQVMGGIGYTNIYPVEKILRDLRLTMIWTGSNEIMNLLIQHEYYKELEAARGLTRDIEPDAAGAEIDGEKIFE
jgi:acyl-CoA dehydrogenase